MEDPDGFYIYDDVTYAPLKRLGWEVIEVAWSRPTEPWHHFDAVVIRSTWDYQDHVDAFFQTLATIESAKVPLLNSRSTCRWNMDKSYLRQLARTGVPIIPTLWLDRLDLATLEFCLQRFEAHQGFVVKPRVGANADNLFVLDDTRNMWAEAARVFENQALMAQPFLPSIQSLGEYSLFYFGDAYSHAILKRPQAGDCRVQEEHGGTITAVKAPPEVKSLAERSLEAINSALGETLLYARIDVVQLDDGSFALIEAELIEPSLYFSFDPESPQRFASVLNRMLS